MVPTLSSSEKLSASGASNSALFGSETKSLARSLATNNTLEGQEPVFPSAAKMTLIVPNGGLEEAFL